MLTNTIEIWNMFINEYPDARFSLNWLVLKNDFERTVYAKLLRLYGQRKCV